MVGEVADSMLVGDKSPCYEKRYKPGNGICLVVGNREEVAETTTASIS